MDKTITKKFERMTCTWCGTDRRWRQHCARGPACWRQAEAMGGEPSFLDLAPKERKKFGNAKPKSHDPRSSRL